MNPSFTGNNVLIVEDEMLLALMLEDLLLDRGHHVVHAPSLPDAIAAVEREHFDAAILDINLNGEEVFPVASRLRELQTPFVFASASDAALIEPAFQDEQLIAKPYTIGQLERFLERALPSSGH